LIKNAQDTLSTYRSSIHVHVISNCCLARRFTVQKSIQDHTSQYDGVVRPHPFDVTLPAFRIGKDRRLRRYRRLHGIRRVPGALLPMVIAVEVLGSIAIILGWHTRVVSLLLAGFTVATVVLFHNNWADQMQVVMFLKNLSITGAFLMLAANGAGAFSLDARNAK
jgi:uncharacterized membrane protein YphA (DoxX/SURF4 family)